MKKFLLLILFLLLSGCGFKLQGEKFLPLPLHHLYLQTPDPYGTLERNLRDSLKMSGVTITPTPDSAEVSLIVTQDNSYQVFLGVSGTQQTRQYNLVVAVSFELQTKNGEIILPNQTMSEARTITIQSSQILGTSNEAILYYQQMRRSLATGIMNRIGSREVSRLIMNAFEKR